MNFEMGAVTTIERLKAGDGILVGPNHDFLTVLQDSSYHRGPVVLNAMDKRGKVKKPWGLAGDQIRLISRVSEDGEETFF